MASRPTSLQKQLIIAWVCQLHLSRRRRLKNKNKGKFIGNFILKSWILDSIHLPIIRWLRNWSREWEQRKEIERRKITRTTNSCPRKKLLLTLLTQTPKVSDPFDSFFHTYYVSLKRNEIFGVLFFFLKNSRLVDGKNSDKASVIRSKHSVTEQRRRSKINERYFCYSSYCYRLLFFHFYFTCKVNFLLSLRACNVYMFLNFVCFCCWAWVLTVHGTVLWLKF